MRNFGDFRGFSGILEVGGDNGVITHIYPPDGVFPHLTRAYPQDRVEGPAYHSPNFLGAGVCFSNKQTDVNRKQL